MDGASPLVQGQHDSSVQSASVALQMLETNGSPQPGVNKFFIYLSASEQHGGHLDALIQSGLGGNQLASYDPGCEPFPAIAVVTKQSPSMLLQSAKCASSEASAKECAISKKAEDGKPTDCIVRPLGKLQTTPWVSWPVQEGSPRRESLLQRRLRSMPNGPLALKIDCFRSTSPGSTADTVTIPNPAPRSLFDFYDLLPDVVGRGSFGTVRFGVRKEDGKKVAVKIIPSVDDEFTMMAKQEFKLLRSINHPYVVQALDLFYATTCTELVLDYFQGNTMEDAVTLSPRQSLLEGNGTLLFVMMLHALAHLHKMQVIHRDVKPQNILISEDFQDLRLIDFNSARRTPEETCENWALSPTGTCIYAAPEVVAGEEHGASSDVWSAGLCWHFMLVGELPQGRGLHRSFGNFRKVATATVTLTSSRWQSISEPCKSTLRRCLDLDHCGRPTADSLLKEECFAAAIEVTSQHLQGLS